VGEGMDGETLVSEGRVGLVPGVILLVVLIPLVVVRMEATSCDHQEGLRLWSNGRSDGWNLTCIG
jgi:hypothetical protein